MASLAADRIFAVNPEIWLAAAVAVAALAGRRLGWWERPLARLARHRRPAILLAALFPMALRALLLPFYPAPAPHIHDEFAFLLAADTFLHGRVANPPHPLWVHFESVHILTHPVYASVFPIAPAAALALGKALFGHPWAGVWLSGGLMCGAICWMLQGWVPPRWALLGALLAGLRFAVAGYWMNSYWGGFVAAAGGALALGALGRLRRTPRPRHALAMAAGLAVLANSRPLEGAVFGAALVAVWLWSRPRWRELLPFVLALAAAGAGMGYYFWRVTGKPWRVPYVVYRQTRTIAPHFVWQKPRPAPPLYSNAEATAFYLHWEMYNYRLAHEFPADLERKSGAYWRFYFGPLFTLPLIALPRLWRSRKARPLLFVAAVFPLALIGQVWHNPHYAAPATALVVLIVILCLRLLRTWRPIGAAAAAALPLACAAMLAVQALAGPQPPGAVEATWRWPERKGVERASMARRLESLPGRHLVLVRYEKRHDPGDEWVYNGADIDGSRVVWARELDRATNEKLLRYFADRQVWLAEPDAAPPRLTPYRDAPPHLMRFVALGAPGIDALANVKAKVQAIDGPAPRSCYKWNYEFQLATGVEAPGVTADCYGSDMANEVSLDDWYRWLARQRW